MIKVYKIDALKYTPFDSSFDPDDFAYLQAEGITITNSVVEADLFVAYDSKKLKRFMIRNPFRRPLLLWTNEPRLSQIKAASYRPFRLLSRVHLMNVYTGDVFINNVTYQKKRFSKANKLALVGKDFKLSNKIVAALMSYYNAGLKSALYIDDVNIDLVRKRSEIGIYGYENGVLDIYGSGWPESMSKEDSRSGSWSNRKSELLNDYFFNLCFENTVSPKYITEKIWDSIENYCLPIYYGGLNSTIYEIFPQGSFLDYADFEDPEALFQAIGAMKESEFVDRMNLCITVYNEFVDQPADYWRQNRRIVLDHIINKCKELSKV